MLESIIKINQAVNGFIWGVPAMICIIGVGLLLSVRTRFIQVRKFGAALKNTIGKIFDKTQAKDGSMEPVPGRLSTALAGTVGTGNIAGVLRGRDCPRRSWRNFLDVVLCFSRHVYQIFPRLRSQSISGKRTQMANMLAVQCTYIKNGLSKKWHFLAVLYALFGVLTVFGTGYGHPG